MKKLHLFLCLLLAGITTGFAQTDTIRFTATSGFLSDYFKSCVQFRSDASFTIAFAEENQPAKIYNSEFYNQNGYRYHHVTIYLTDTASHNYKLYTTEGQNISYARFYHIKSLKISSTSLLELNSYSSNPTKLDVSECPALTSLNCSDNKLTQLDLSHNSALTFLNCEDNKLTELDLSHNPALTVLDCRFNKLTELDLSHNPALTSLTCSANQLTQLDLSHNPALTELYCHWNKLTELDLSGCKQLRVAFCARNNIQTLNIFQSSLDPTSSKLNADDNGLSLSQCYKLVQLGRNHKDFLHTAQNQTVKLSLEKGKSLDLRQEMEFNGAATEFSVHRDSSLAEDTDFEFSEGFLSFKKAGDYIVRLHNDRVFSNAKFHGIHSIDWSSERIENAPVTVSYHISVRETVDPDPDDPVSNAAQNRLPAFRAYPNPCGEMLYLKQGSEENAADIQYFRLLDLQGCERFRVRGDASQIDMSQLPAGVYVLEATDGNGASFRHKIVKR